jgi:hypothetical protein
MAGSTSVHKSHMHDRADRKLPARAALITRASPSWGPRPRKKNARVPPEIRENPGVGRIRRTIRGVMVAAGLEPATPTM